MDIKYYTDKGFEFFCVLEPSDRYKQGIGLDTLDINLKAKKDYYNNPGVYILASKRTGEVLKIGQTSSILHRFNTQYKCVTNTTNNRIREYIRDVEDVAVYIYRVEKMKYTILGHEVCMSAAMGLEHELLKEYKQKNNKLPELNTMIR